MNDPGRRALLVFLWLAALTSCTVGPDYQRPDVQIPERWTGSGPTPDATPSELAEAGLATWWEAFGDPVLSSLVDRAFRSNLDLELAEARIREARAARGGVISDRGPRVEAAGSYQRKRSTVSTPTVGRGGEASGSSQEIVFSDQYESGFDAGWEIDLFGGIRRGAEAADADVQAEVEACRNVLVTLAAEVARNYIDLRASQERIAIARQNLEAQQQTAELTRELFRGGVEGGLPVARAEAQVKATASDIPLLEASARQLIHGLGILLGREPAALLQELSSASSIPPVPPSVPVGVPSDLLRRRPDIRRAEVEIRAATARIGVATAELYPKLELSGALGARADDLSSWSSPLSRFWSLGPSVTWKLFDNDRTLSDIALKEALQEQTIVAYRQTVLAALQDVENALIASEKESERRELLGDAVAANRRAVELATKLYSEGQTNFLDVLDAQRSLYASEDALVQSTRSLSTHFVALYKSLGGGWQTRPESDVEK